MMTEKKKQACCGCLFWSMDTGVHAIIGAKLGHPGGSFWVHLCGYVPAPGQGRSCAYTDADYVCAQFKSRAK